ncbi:MAG: GNAT family N-acetyltransferase [Bacillota bacterium]|nr:GNAT family N-acetyltransferase [Bacillota bacterium]
MIRKLSEKDINEISEIWLSANLQAHNFVPAAYWKSNLPLVKEMLPKAEVYVYEESQAITGFIGVNEDCIEGIFVKSDARSKGIGKELLDFVKALKSYLYLHVYEKNSRAVCFYKRENFRLEREGIDENTGEKEYCMEWKREYEKSI